MIDHVRALHLPVKIRVRPEIPLKKPHSRKSHLQNMLKILLLPVDHGDDILFPAHSAVSASRQGCREIGSQEAAPSDQRTIHSLFCLLCRNLCLQGITILSLTFMKAL